MKTVRHVTPAYAPKASRGNRREVFSPKLNRPVTLYSDLEFEHYLLLEGDPEVAAFCEQPCTMSAEVDGKRITAVPDCWVLFRNGREQYREVKYAEDLRNLDPQARAWRQTEAMRRSCTLNGFDFLIETETEIRADPVRLRNWERILPYLADITAVRKAGLDTVVLERLNQLRTATLREMGDYFPGHEPAEVHRVMFLLLWQGRLATEISRPLDRDSRFEVV